MEENTKKYKKINLFIPKLLEQSNKYTTIFKDKKKINNIFREFDNKSSNYFNFFIKESTDRYKNMKLGNDLNKVIANSEKRRKTEINRVLTDNYFTDEGIKQEKKNSKHYTSDKVYNNLKETIKIIKNLGSDTGEINDKNDKKMEKNNNLLEDREAIQDFKKTKEILNKVKEDLNYIFEKEKQNIGKMFDKYRNDVNILQKIGEKSQEKYAIMHKKLDLALPKIEMINYEHYEPPKHIEKDVGILQKKTLEKLIPFTKYYRNNNNININKSNSNIIDLKLKKIFKKLILNYKLLDHPEIITANKTISRNLKKVDLNDTNNVIYNTAYKELSASKFFDEKRRKLTENLGYEIPKEQKYKSIIKNKFKDIKITRNKNNKKLLKNQKLISMTYYDKMNLKINNGINFLTKVENNILKKPLETK